MKKGLFSILAVVLILGFILPSSSLASTELSNKTVRENDSKNNTVTPNVVNPYRYSKENVKVTYQWSSYKRVSDNMKTGSKGGSITSNKSAKFTTVVSGGIAGLNFSFGSKSSSIGYTLHVPANSRKYMAYRVKYRVETGTRVRTDIVTGKKVKNKYTVKNPQHGEYKLLNY